VRIPWSSDKCILCHKRDALTVEHIIPECLGGKLTSQFLCWGCNSNLGHALEAEARSDPSVRLAVHNLQSGIPELAKKLTENQNCLACGPGGKAPGRLRKGEFKVKSRTAPDGSLIQPTHEARKSIRAILTKSGVEPALVDAAVDTFDQAPENKRVQVWHGLEVVKWGVERVELDLSGSQVMTPLVPFKIAFEFLACHLGASVYDADPQLLDLRQALRSTTDVNPSFRVERLAASRYELFHGVCFEGNAPHARLQVRLFGWLAFRVHFLRLAVECDRYAYTHYLSTGKEYLCRINSPSVGIPAAGESGGVCT
jgi:hypothetical protein